MKEKIEEYKKIIFEEMDKKHPKWSLVMEYAEKIRNIEYPDDTSRLYEYSGIIEMDDNVYEYHPPIIDDNEDYWK